VFQKKGFERKRSSELKEPRSTFKSLAPTSVYQEETTITMAARTLRIGTEFSQLTSPVSIRLV